MILIIIKFCELLLRISPRIINSLRSYIKHSKECFLLFPNTSKLVKKIRLRLVFPTYFSVFGNRRKHSSSCLIYYIYNSKDKNKKTVNYVRSCVQSIVITYYTSELRTTLSHPTMAGQKVPTSGTIPAAINSTQYRENFQ